MAKTTKYENNDQLLLIKEMRNPKEIFRNIRNYLAGQFIGATRDDALLDEVMKCLFCKLLSDNDEAYTLNYELNTFDFSKQVRNVFIAVKSKFPEIYNDNDEILIDPESIKFLMNEINFKFNDAFSDPIGDAFEVFVGSESRGRAGQFFTPRSVTNLLVNAIEPDINDKILDPACGAGGFLASTCSYFLSKGISNTKLSNIVSKNLYGIDKDEYLTKLSRMHLALITGGHPNIIYGDSIALQNGKYNIRDLIPKDGFDVIITNPPFGVKIVSAKPDTLQSFELSKRWIINKSNGLMEPTSNILSNVPPQVLFVERCLTLLKPGGRLGMVLPESLLSNKSYRHVVEYIMKKSDVQAIIGMPDALFKTSGKGGTHTKTCLMVTIKKGGNNVKRTNSIFMAEAKWCGQDSRGRNIPHNDLPTISQNYEYFKNNKLVDMSDNGFIIEKSKVMGNILCPRYYDPNTEEEITKLERTHYLLEFGSLVRDNIISINTGDEVGKLAYGTGDIPFIRTSDISNWELKSDPKHCVSRDIYKSLCKKQDVKPGDILMVKDGTYLIGTCAIVTEADIEILYQSHLYKIRINANEYGINPYLLIAILSSPIVQKQIRSKQFTQDIIDSLGERINEIILPIPKSTEIREKISKYVEQSMTQRVEARKLASKALDCITLASNDAVCNF